jgi:hypothetical protein
MSLPSLDKPSPTQAAVVTAERKRELLVEARQARVSWVESSSSPYRNSLENDENSFGLLGTSSASNYLESAIPVISVLYGKHPTSDDELMKKEIEKRIRSQVDIVKDELENEDLNENKFDPIMDHYQSNDQEFLSTYKNVIRKLSLPESAELVQGMRHYDRALTESVDIAEKNETSIQEQNKIIEKVATLVQHSLKSLHSKFATHPFWKSDGNLSTESKSALDVFMYSKWKAIIYNILQNDDKKQEDELSDRLSFLQFVKPLHLDLPFFGSGEAGDWMDILSKPIALLTTLDLLYSPAQMLQCTTEIYRSINEILSNRMKDEKDGKVPSADDILPTLVLATICAKPKQIVANLRFLECFATEEQMRGESGYAFTSLFSAVQFIREIRLDEEKEGSESGNGSVPSLSISEKELREKLESFRAALTPKETKKQDDDMKKDDSSDNEDGFISKNMNMIDIPVGELKAARIRGEDLNKWASDWVENNCNHAANTTPSGEETGQIGDSTSAQRRSQALPDGFKRSYSYLSTEAKDIRLSDIEPLLKEYKMLVYVTENLLSERSAIQSNAEKEKLKLKRDELNRSLAQASDVFNGRKGA